MATQYYYPLTAPTPTPNGVVTLFNTATAYIASTLKVYRDGILLYKDVDYAETSSTAGTFTMFSAPASDEQLRVEYFSTEGVTGISPDWFDTRTIVLYSMMDNRIDIDPFDGVGNNNEYEAPVIYFDGVGTRLKVYTGVDLSAASAVSLKIEKPSGAIVSLTGFLDANNPYYVMYTIATNDFDIEGDYFVSAEATINSIVSRGKVTKFIGKKQYLSQI